MMTRENIAICATGVAIIGVIVAIMFALSSCIPPSAEPGLCNLAAQAKYTLNTKQVCIRSQEAARVADLAWLLSLDALAEDGFVTDRRKAVEQLRGSTNLVCLVEQPEPCCIGNGCVGPYQEGTGKPARKAGCASDMHAWASIAWPPVCTAEWPDEPHCVAQGVETTGWPERLRHEIFNMAVLRWVKVRDPSYQHRVYTETEPKVAERFRRVTQ
jgi:hypothetical protein